MPLPTFLTFVRHGQSEANVAQDLVKRGLDKELPVEFARRHDSLMRLTPLGVKQAEATGKWLRENWDHPDRFYASPHVRARETAATLALGGEWRVDDRFRERDWGELFSHQPMPEVMRDMKQLDQWYWKPTGGESLATGVRLRVESVMNSLYRRGGRGVNHNVLAVAHYEFISVAQFVIERLTPEQWRDRDDDPAYKIRNTMVLQYTTKNPYDAEDDTIHTHYTWRRAICPWDRTLDWDGGEWVNVESVKHSDADLMAEVNRHPHLFSNGE